VGCFVSYWTTVPMYLSRGVPRGVLTRRVILWCATTMPCCLLKSRLEEVAHKPLFLPTSSTAPPAPILSMSFAGSPLADTLPLTPAELDAVRADFWEMMEWWRDRKLKQIHKSVPRDLQRQTYHVERRYIELIREEAEADGVSITEVVNRALRAYFERRKNGAAP
jgi:hypothetical protein